MNVMEKVKTFLGWCPDANKVYMETRIKTRTTEENWFITTGKALGVCTGFLMFAFFLRGIVLYTLVWHSPLFGALAEKTYYLPALVVLSFFSAYFGFLGRSTQPKQAVLYTGLTFVFMLVVVGALNYVVGSSDTLLISWQTQSVMVKYMLRTYAYDWVIPFGSGVFFVLLLGVPSILYAFAVSKWRSIPALILLSVAYAFLLPTWMDITDLLVVPESVFGWTGFYLWILLYGLFISLWVALFDFVKRRKFDS